MQQTRLLLSSFIILSFCCSFIHQVSSQNTLKNPTASSLHLHEDQTSVLTVKQSRARSNLNYEVGRVQVIHRPTV